VTSTDPLANASGSVETAGVPSTVPLVGRDHELAEDLADSAVFAVGGQASAALIPGSTLTVYPGAPHGITDTHKDQLGRDLLAFAQS
jgi:hypothetical protein